MIPSLLIHDNFLKSLFFLFRNENHKADYYLTVQTVANDPNFKLRPISKGIELEHVILKIFSIT